jgi:hypothetical protein
MILFQLFVTSISDISGTGGKFATGIVGTGGKFATGSKLATGVVDTSGAS